MLVEPELKLLQREHHLSQGLVAHFAELVFWIHEVIARIDATVVLQRYVLAAEETARTHQRRLTVQLRKEALE